MSGTPHVRFYQRFLRSLLLVEYTDPAGITLQVRAICRRFLQCAEDMESAMEVARLWQAFSEDHTHHCIWGKGRVPYSSDLVVGLESLVVGLAIRYLPRMRVKEDTKGKRLNATQEEYEVEAGRYVFVVAEDDGEMEVIVPEHVAATEVLAPLVRLQRKALVMPSEYRRKGK